MEKGTIYVVNGFKATSKKTGKDFCGINAVVPGADGNSIRMLICSEDCKKYVDAKGGGYYRYEVSFSGAVVGLELVKPFTL